MKNLEKFDIDEKIVLNHFNKKIEEHKKGAKALSWQSKDSQQVRFQVLSEIGDLKGKTILDVGCGFGDFHGFLVNKKKIKVKKYLGIDLNPLMILRAKREYPSSRFEERDILKNRIQGRFDYVVASGLFFLKTPHWEELTYEILSKMFKISKMGVGANFLSLFSQGKKDENSYYADPSKILKFICTYLTSKVILRQDYRPNDFTVFFYINFKR